MGQLIKAERPVEVFGTVRRLPMQIELMAGNLEVYELLELAHDETTIMFFGLAEQKLEIAFGQFFAGCAEPAQRWPDKRVIGFVRRDGALWTHSRWEGRFEKDAPGVVHQERNPGDLILAPTFQPYALV